MCFPGGERECEDASPWETALREAREEILLDPRRVEPVCPLPKAHAFVSGFDVFPVLGFVDCTNGGAELKPNEGEIVSYCLADISRLDGGARLRTFECRGRLVQSPEYVLEDGSVVWGVTGTILSNVLFGFHREGWFR
jgi:8-oxo-dGTP pyrophosphatase MutT (NUDIX family)